MHRHAQTPVALLALTALAACRAGDGPEQAEAAPARPEPAPVPAAVPGTEPAPDGDPPAASGCRSQPFARWIPVAEASGSAWLPAAGEQPALLLVVGDSGNRGELNALDAETGAVVATGRLPLDGAASDDLEGLAWADGVLYAITSSGFMRHWQPGPAGPADFTLSEPAYPLGKPGGDLVCARGREVNCGKNYEGLCLRRDPVGDGECAGFAAAKGDGALDRLVRAAGGKLALDGTRRIPISKRGALTGCDFAPDGDVLWAGTNMFDAGRVFAVRGWRDPAKATVEDIAPLGPGFPESIASGPGGVVYRFSDMSSRPSLVRKYVCE